jgi:hypothetical protein
VQNLCSQLFAGPAPSSDLAYLAAKTFEKTTDERFKLNVMMRMSVEEEAGYESEELRIGMCGLYSSLQQPSNQ